MTKVDAIFRRGVFEPLEPVRLQENERVRLNIESAPAAASGDWLEELRALHAQILARNGGPLPDSAPDIAEDRMR
jgi:predicted DNA-binding antitoxin AbrB/MazE fold protein